MEPTEVQRISGLARIELTDAEVARFAQQLTAILDYFCQLQELSTEGVPPAAHPEELVGPLRADDPMPWQETQKLVQECRDSQDGFYVVPRILE